MTPRLTPTPIPTPTPVVPDQEGNHINHRALNVAWLLATVRTLPRRLRNGHDVDVLLHEMKLHEDSYTYFFIYFYFFCTK